MSDFKSTDNENPVVKASKVFGFIERDAVFSTTVFSIFINMSLANLVVYGFTGNSKWAFFSSLLAIPFSMHSCFSDAENDFKQWKKQAKLRESGVPESVLPYKCKYDWTLYEDKIRFTREDKNNEKI